MPRSINGTAPERWTKDELFSRYKLEPSIRDIYVEGPTDKRIFEWFISENNLNNLRVYEIDRVEIPNDEIRDIIGCSGQKSRIIALAKFLEIKIGKTPNFIGIVDRDFDDFLNLEWNCSLLFKTDYSCVEMYYFNEKFFRKFFTFYLKTTEGLWKEIYDQFSLILPELFLIRIAKEKSAKEMNLIPFENYFGINKGKIEFKYDEHIKQSLNKNNNPITQDEFIESVNSFRKNLKKDPRYQIHGHDFIEILCWWARKAIKKHLITRKEAIESGFYTCLEADDLSKEKLFYSLISWAK